MLYAQRKYVNTRTLHYEYGTSISLLYYKIEDFPSSSAKLAISIVLFRLFELFIFFFLFTFLIWHSFKFKPNGGKVLYECKCLLLQFQRPVIFFHICKYHFLFLFVLGLLIWYMMVQWCLCNGCYALVNDKALQSKAPSKVIECFIWRYVCMFASFGTDACRIAFSRENMYA